VVLLEPEVQIALIGNITALIIAILPYIKKKNNTDTSPDTIIAPVTEYVEYVPVPVFLEDEDSMWNNRFVRFIMLVLTSPIRFMKLLASHITFTALIVFVLTGAYLVLHYLPSLRI